MDALYNMYRVMQLTKDQKVIFRFFFKKSLFVLRERERERERENMNESQTSSLGSAWSPMQGWNS